MPGFLPQKLPRFWFTQNIRYFVYFLREFTGVIIALFIMLIFGLGWLPAPDHGWVDITLNVAAFIALGASIFHTLTWLYVTTKLSPIPLKPAFQKIAYAFLLLAWLGVSYLALKFFFSS